jgi:hypothetical protein
MLEDYFNSDNSPMTLQSVGICVSGYRFMKLLLFLSHPTVCVTGGWGEEVFKTENCQYSGKRSKSQTPGAHDVRQCVERKNKPVPKHPIRA